MVYKRGTFSVKMVYKRVRGWTSGRSLPVLNFVKYPPRVDLSEGEGLFITQSSTKADVSGEIGGNVV